MWTHASTWMKLESIMLESKKPDKPDHKNIMYATPQQSLQRPKVHLQFLELGERGRKRAVNTSRGSLATTVVKAAEQLREHVKFGGHSEQENSMLFGSSCKADIKTHRHR